MSIGLKRSTNNLFNQLKAIKEKEDPNSNKYTGLSIEELNDITRDLFYTYEALGECLLDAEKLLSFYWGKDGAIDTQAISDWIKKASENSESSLYRPAFFVELIEQAGQMALDKSVAKHMATVGVKGRQTRNKPNQELKDWAVQEAESLKMSDKDAARQLSARIPAHLAGASKNPEQLIYRTLLARHQAK